MLRKQRGKSAQKLERKWGKNSDTYTKRMSMSFLVIPQCFRARWSGDRTMRKFTTFKLVRERKGRITWFLICQQFLLPVIIVCQFLVVYTNPTCISWRCMKLGIFWWIMVYFVNTLPQFFFFVKTFEDKTDSMWFSPPRCFQACITMENITNYIISM